MLASITLAAALFWSSVFAAGAITYQTIQQRRTAKETSSTAKKLAAEQAKFQSELAGEQIGLTKKQMELQMGQQAIQTLADSILKDPEPEILTLPPTWQPDLFDQINLRIDRFVRG